MMVDFETELKKQKKLFENYEFFLGAINIVIFAWIIFFGIVNIRLTLGLFLFDAAIMLIYLALRRNYDVLQDFYVYYILQGMNKNENRNKSK